METNNTPGPWFVDMESRTATVRSATGRAIARCYQGDDDARFVAAAPDLFNALLIAEAALAAYSGGESSDLDTIRDAIAKATGGNV